MSAFDEVLARLVAAPRAATVEELAWLLSDADAVSERRLREAALALRREHCGAKVNLRGLVECSNHCLKDCRYCGIRRSNDRVFRYRLSEDEIVACAERVAEWGYGSLVLQAGELESDGNTAFYERVLERIRPFGLGVTLSLGEQTAEVYRRWREAGAARYLLRIETSNPDLYAALHPASHSWSRRVACLRDLRRLGYQVGTGVMIGLPGQTAVDLARDLAFFGEIDADMIGMGPFIPHPDTPLAAAVVDAGRSYRLALRMIALARLYLHDVNIAASTALQALAPDGREQGVLSGANVVMPNVTPQKCRADYRLYAGKPADDENSPTARVRLAAAFAALGETVNFGGQGNSPHYVARTSCGFGIIPCGSAKQDGRHP